MDSHSCASDLKFSWVWGFEVRANFLINHYICNLEKRVHLVPHSDSSTLETEEPIFSPPSSLTLQIRPLTLMSFISGLWQNQYPYSTLLLSFKSGPHSFSFLPVGLSPTGLLTSNAFFELPPGSSFWEVNQFNFFAMLPNVTVVVLLNSWKFPWTPRIQGQSYTLTAEAEYSEHICIPCSIPSIVGYLAVRLKHVTSLVKSMRSRAPSWTSPRLWRYGLYMTFWNRKQISLRGEIKNKFVKMWSAEKDLKGSP